MEKIVKLSFYKLQEIKSWAEKCKTTPKTSRHVINISTLQLDKMISLEICYRPQEIRAELSTLQLGNSQSEVGNVEPIVTWNYLKYKHPPPTTVPPRSINIRSRIYNLKGSDLHIFVIGKSVKNVPFYSQRDTQSDTFEIWIHTPALLSVCQV